MLFKTGRANRARDQLGLGARTGLAQPAITEAHLRHWLADAGFGDVRYHAHRGFALFGAVKRGP
jgi:hypothetical protein